MDAINLIYTTDAQLLLRALIEAVAASYAVLAVLHQY